MTTYYHGEYEGSTNSAHITRDAEYNTGYIKAMASNTGNVYIGSSSDVTRASTDTNNTAGFELAAGDVLPLDWPGNLNDFWYITDNAGDDFCYVVTRWATT